MRKRKKIVPKQQASVQKETQTISNHEDTALKVTAQFFQEEIMPAFQIEGKVVGMLPTEEIHLELRKGFEDCNFLMDDDSIKHFEFQSENEGKIGLKRFRFYEAEMSYKYKKAVTTYVLFSGNIKKPMTEFTEGINTYRIHPIIMQEHNADEVIRELQRKVENGESLTKADLLPLTLVSLMSGEMSQKDRVSAAYGITQGAKGVDEEVIQKVEAVLYIMADKFLNSEEMEQLKEEIRMTRLGKMLYDDGKEAGRLEGRCEGRREGQLDILVNLIRKQMKIGMAEEDIMDMLDEENDMVQKIYNVLRSHSEKSNEEVYRLVCQE